MCALRRPLWKHLQNDDAVPTKIENAFQKNSVKHLAVNARKVGSTFPQRNPPIACCGLVEFRRLMAERSPGRAIKVSAPTAPDGPFGNGAPTGPFYSQIARPSNVGALRDICGGRGNSISLTLQEVFHLMGADIGGIDIAHRVSRNTSRRSTRPYSTEVARIRYEREQRPIDGTADHDAAQFSRLHSRRRVASGRLVAECDADINLVIRSDENRAWLAKLIPGGDEIAVLVENLDTAVEAIGNVDATQRTAKGDIVRVIEIAGCRSFVTPGLNEAAILGEFEDPAVIGGIAAMAIGNKNIAIGRNRHAGWPIEGIRAAPADAHLAKHHQHLAVLVELENLLSKNDARRIARRHAKYSLLVIDIADPQIALMVDGEPVRIDEHAAAEALEEPAGWIKLQDRRIGIAATETGGDAGRHGVEAAMEDPNIAIAVDMHADDLTPAAAIHALGQGRPALDKAIGIG